jgi:hypothetical protein
LKKAYVRMAPDYDTLDIVVNCEQIMVLRRGAMEEVAQTIVAISEEPKDVKGKPIIRLHSFLIAF